MMTWLCDNLTRHNVMYDNIKGIMKRVCNTHHRLFNLSLFMHTHSSTSFWIQVDFCHVAVTLYTSHVCTTLSLYSAVLPASFDSKS